MMCRETRIIAVTLAVMASEISLFNLKPLQNVCYDIQKKGAARAP